MVKKNLHVATNIYFKEGKEEGEEGHDEVSESLQ